MNELEPTTASASGEVPSAISPTLAATAEVSTAVRSLLEGNTINDVTDRGIIEAALAFIENPTEDLKEIEKHLEGIGMVLAYNYREIEDQPPALSDINRRLFILISQVYIKLIETERKKDAPDSAKVQEWIDRALNFTGVLAKYYKDTTFLNRVKELQAQR